MVRVEQGKGKKDRYTILSERLLLELRKYWKEHRSPMYLFPNAKGSPISINYAQRIYNLAKEKAEIQKAAASTYCAIALLRIFWKGGWTW